jgi:hypothetical protein
MPRSAPYVGLSGGKREVFHSPTVPTDETHGDRFAAVIGPFRTVRGATWMAHPVRGAFNPHCRDVSDAERLAKKYASEYDPKTRSWASLPDN